MSKFTEGYKTYDPDREGYGNKRQWTREFRHRLNPDQAKAILQEDDPLTILGVTEHSTKDQIRNAWKKLAIKWHPDKNPDNVAMATLMMQKINAAYDMIRDGVGIEYIMSKYWGKHYE